MIWEVAEDGDEDLMAEGKDVLPSFWVKECILDDNLHTLEEDAIGRSQTKNPISIGHLGFKIVSFCFRGRVAGLSKKVNDGVSINIRREQKWRERVF